MDANYKLRIQQAKTLFSPLGEITTRSQFGGYSVAAEGVMFALILEGECWLRGIRGNEDRYSELGMRKLIYTKRDIPVTLNYYHLPEALWDAPATLIVLGRQTLEEARRERQVRADHPRLKDLPNIGQGIERLLWKAGIQNVDALRNHGAKASYLKLRNIKRDLSVKVLLALEGALSGRHLAALPPCLRNELMEWLRRHA
ncbi:TfoX/Sxy family DNA transformation protein [Sodalis praecaptivus]|uniref:TfoX/Sxy family DNA transformation protein n=1 Tax=Sodalis praecaptivus TaxID=1239307 RepID=UPI0027F443DF|nr:TfoX/Sxy family DNA transformation protein [Sodalis praecaptivus]CAJ0994874.1 Protein Sxy [Sodalis praecaptivus]